MRSLQDSYLPDITAPDASTIKKSASGPVGRGSRRQMKLGTSASHVPVKQSVALRSLDSVTAKQLSRSESMLTPTWDPVKQQLVTDPMVEAPLWRAGVTKSMRRALAAGAASQGQLSRPSIAIARAATERAIERRNERRAGMGNKPDLLKPDGWGNPGDPNSLRAQKTDVIDMFTGKLHDEELVEQQLNASIKGTMEAIALEESSVDEDAAKAVERSIVIQLKIVSDRANDMVTRANTTRADNHRQRGVINKLRLEARAHNNHAKQIRERLQLLEKELPQLLEKCQAAIYEGEKIQMKVLQAHQDATLTARQQSEMLGDAQDMMEHTDKQNGKMMEEAFEETQAEAHESYTRAKAERTAQNMAEAKLGYLKWKSEWWEREFDRLERTTGLKIQMGDDGGTSGSTTELMQKFLTLSQESDSLVSYLQTTDGAIEKLEHELKGLLIVKAEKQRERAAQGKDAASRPSTAAMRDRMSNVDSKSEKVEELLKSCFPTTAQALVHLGAVADYHAQILETAAVAKEFAKPAPEEVKEKSKSTRSRPPLRQRRRPQRRAARQRRLRRSRRGWPIQSQRQRQSQRRRRRRRRRRTCPARARSPSWCGLRRRRPRCCSRGSRARSKAPPTLTRSTCSTMACRCSSTRSTKYGRRPRGWWRWRRRRAPRTKCPTSSATGSSFRRSRRCSRCSPCSRRSSWRRRRRRRRSRSARRSCIRPVPTTSRTAGGNRTAPTTTRRRPSP